MPDPHATISPANAFPSTQETWIGHKLREGKPGHTEVVQHVMEVYAQPLVVYLCGTSFGGSGDPVEVVDDFFADRLSRNGFLQDWLMSRRQLRYWLMVSFKHYLLERARAQRREDDLPRRAAAAQVRSVAADAERDYHRQMALALVREALRQAEQSCRNSGLAEHWQAFVQHHDQGRSYEEIARQTGIDARRLTVMARTAANHVRLAVRRLAAWEGADDVAIDDEIRSLMEVIQS